MFIMNNYLIINTSTASFSVVISPTFPGKITYGVIGNLLSCPVCHTGIPGFICPSTLAFFTASALVPYIAGCNSSLCNDKAWRNA